MSGFAKAHATSSSDRLALAALMTAFAMTGPVSAEPPSPALPRVLFTVARSSSTASDIIIPGDVQARYQSNTAFRVGGRISERFVEVGQHVSAEKVLARLEPEQQRADLRDAEAALASARASAEQARITFVRQQELMKGRYTTQAAYDGAEQQQRATKAQVSPVRHGSAACASSFPTPI